MIKYQQPDTNHNQNLGGEPGPGPRRPLGSGLGNFRFRYVLIIVAFAFLLGVVAYGAYKIGVNQGVEVGNADRDLLYKQRIAELTNYGAATPAASGTPGTQTTPGATTTASSNPVITSGQGTLARIDKVEGDKMTVLLLDSKTGAPNGVSLVISLSQQPTVWKSDRTDSTALAPGQNILFVGESNGNNGTYTVRGVLILPLADQ